MKLLFICTHNACRSILSEAITRDIATDRIEVASAGSHPADQVHPLTLKYLKANGYSTEGLFSKSIDALRLFKSNVVVTVCDNAAKETCPIWLDEAVKAHWSLSDPSQQEGTDADKAEAFVKVIATIERRINGLLEYHFEPWTLNS